MNFPGFFDPYGRQARLQPALLAFFPLFLTCAVWFPALYEFATGLVALAFACGFTVALAHFSRARGRAVEASLFTLWGGKPTTIWLRSRDSSLDAYTKARYHSFFEENIQGWTRPTIAEEKNTPEDSDLRYETAVKWLLENTRDTTKYPLVFKELVSYGFRRNVFGLRFTGISIGLLSVFVNITPLSFFVISDQWFFVFPSGIFSLLVCASVSAGWIFIVRPSWVRDAANAFAKALLAVCDSPPVPPNQTSRNRNDK